MAYFKKTLTSFSSLVMLPHSLFSLPYGIVAILFSGSSDIKTIIAVIIALFSARSAANAFNRVADLKFDKLNPRTANRILPTGKITKRFAIIAILVNLLVLCVSVLFVWPFCLLLLPLAVAFCFFYSLSKRFTSLCHFYLGLACGFSVLGAYLGLAKTLNLQIVLLYFGVSLQVAGFDILYSIKDLTFDQKYGLYSIPSRFGKETALEITKITFFASNLCFCLFILFSSSGPFTALAVVFMAIIMQKALKKEFSLSLNGLCSVLFLALYSINFFNKLFEV